MTEKTPRFAGTKFGKDLQNNRNRNYAEEILTPLIVDAVSENSVDGLSTVPEEVGTVKEFVPFLDPTVENPTAYEALYTNYCKNHGAVGTNPSALTVAPSVVTVISDDTDADDWGDWVLLSAAQDYAMSADAIDIAHIDKASYCVVEVAIIDDFEGVGEEVTPIGRTFCSRADITTTETAVDTTIPYITGSKSLNMPVIPAGSAVYTRVKASELSTTVKFAVQVCWYPESLNVVPD